ncbi:MAG: glycogen synthase GlgA, partial [Calditrichia bacterium]
SGKGNGFTFREYSAAAMLKAIQQAVKLFGDKKAWSKLQKNGMRADFSWSSSAKKYLKIYEKAVKKK